MSAPEKPFHDRTGACRYLKTVWGIVRSPNTLAKLACVGGGPRFVKAGRQPLYPEPDLDEWAARLIREPGGEGRAA